MSKAYFTKYLPTSGEIKEGDKYVDNLVRMSLEDFPPLTFSGHKYERDDVNGHYKSPILQSVEGTTTPQNHAQKVKLYLCSRDIKEGDEMTWIGTENQEFMTKFGTKTKYEESVAFLDIHPNWVKVIGEISPESLSWVKEGMEFDEDEAEVFNQLPSSPFGDQSLIPLYYMIKCP
ncbi:MAG TPA: hypothetical protein VHA12_02755, partial [Candidatus Nanoarchaeia archaeon]|nr:hypothetical protein [Candidatus Nanoarchaeia archaeon]